MHDMPQRLGRRLLLAGAMLAVMLATAPARAQEGAQLPPPPLPPQALPNPAPWYPPPPGVYGALLPPPAPPQPPATHVLPPAPRMALAPIGIGVTVAGVAAAAAGLIAAAVTPSTAQSCGGGNGCVTAPDPTREMLVRASIGGGLAFAAVGVPVTIWGLVNDNPAGPPRHNDERMGFGVVATGLGAGFLGAGIATQIDGRATGVARAISAGAIVLGLGLGGLGIPLWINGAKPASEDASYPPVATSLRVGPSSAELVVAF